jgi:multimeric flavodoxin WrbA
VARMTVVVGILGSPRRGGNSDILLDQCLKGAREMGAATTKLVLRDLKIAPCQGCNQCLTSGECMVADGMREVHRALLQADAVVVASPIYFSGLTAQTKCMIDRCQSLWARESILGMKVDHPRKGAIILVGGDPKAVFRNAQSELKAFMKGIGLSFCSELMVAGVEKPGEVRERPEEMLRAMEMGRELA